MVLHNYFRRFYPLHYIKLLLDPPVKSTLNQPAAAIKFDQVISALIRLFEGLQASCQDRYRYEIVNSIKRGIRLRELAPQYERRCHVMKESLGFVIARAPSLLLNGGTGVFVKEGEISPNSLVALYPGSIIYPGESILLQSIKNEYIIRRKDGVFIDGKPYGLSKRIFLSAYRQMNFPGIQYPTADITWLSPWDECLQNPISIGQFINNETPSNPANVMYQELDIPLSMLRRNLWQYLPYLHSNGSPMKYEDVILKTIVLVSCRKIVEGEELRSTYMQRINNHDR